MAFTITIDPNEKYKLAAYLKQHHTGKEKAAKKRELLSAMYGQDAAKDESYNNMLDRKVRKMIEDLINEGNPICSSSTCGYWYAASLNDGMESVAENKSRAITQLENVKKLEANILAEYGGQMGL